jgi:hypothetical protein
MKAVCCNITISNYTFSGVINCTIENSTRSIANKATIELPISAVFENSSRMNISSKIARGDKVTIELGYDDDYSNEFEGYVESIKITDKTVINCENKAFLLRCNIADKIFKSTTIQEVLNYALNGLGISLNSQVPDISLDGFVIKNSTSIKVIQKIKDQYGLVAFIDGDGALYVGLAFVVNSGNVELDLTKCPDKENNLTFVTDDDVKIKVKAISIQKNNERIEVESGDESGDLRTLFFYNISDKAKITELANEEIKKYKFTGYRGSVTSFGWPISNVAMIVSLKDKNYPDREGNYYCEGVKVQFGTNGYRREIELGVML